MGLFTKKKFAADKPDGPILMNVQRQHEECIHFGEEAFRYEGRLYERLRVAIPVVDAALCKIVRLSGGFKLVSADPIYQEELDNFCKNVNVGLTGKSLSAFADCYLDTLITYGNAVGEIILDGETGQIMGLYNGSPEHIEIAPPSNGCCERNYALRLEDGERLILPHPERILFSAINVRNNGIYGSSVLRGLPMLSGILMKIYECIGHNFERVGNLRYAVTYKPGNDPSEKAYAKDRAMQIANEWTAGMNASRHGDIRDFVAVGDVDIKVIGAENQVIDTEVPVRQLLEQLISKLSIPPFLLGLNWSSTERMSAQQADILTSELEFYRRTMTPVLCRIGNAFMRTLGSTADVSIEWDNINLQDETELAEARLKNAQALQIELQIKEQYNL